MLDLRVVELRVLLKIEVDLNQTPCELIKISYRNYIIEGNFKIHFFIFHVAREFVNGKQVSTLHNFCFLPAGFLVVQVDLL